MWMVLMLGAAALGYLWVWQPLSGSAWLAQGSCWVKGGTYTRYTAAEPDYRKFMSANPYNTLRMEEKEANGCLPEGACMAGAVEADALLERKILSWRFVHDRDALGAFLAGKLTEAREHTRKQEQASAVPPVLQDKFEQMRGALAGALGVTKTDAAVAEAKRAEAAFCAAFLEKMRARMPLAKVAKEQEQREKKRENSPAE